MRILAGSTPDDPVSPHSGGGVDPIGGRNFPGPMPYDAARRALRDATDAAIESGVRTQALTLVLIMAVRGQSLPGRHEYALAAQLAALIDHPETDPGRNEP